MTTITFLLASLLAFVAVVVTVWQLAKRDMFFTFGATNEAKIIVRGAKKRGRVKTDEAAEESEEDPNKFADELLGGEFVRAILPPGEYVLNEPRSVNFVPSQRPWEVLRKEPSVPGEVSDVGIEKRYVDERSFFARYFNIYWIGLFPIYRVLRYRFAWDEEGQIKDPEKQKSLERGTLHRDELTTSVFIKPHQYTIFVREAEVQGNLAVNFKIVLTVRIVNPYHAIFKTDNWLRQVRTATTTSALGYVREKDFDNLVREAGKVVRKEDKPEDKPLAYHLIDLSHKIPSGKNHEGDRGVNEGEDRGLISFYGVEILQAEVQTVELSEEELSDEEREATRLVYIAGQKKKAAILEAEGFKEAEKLRGQGTAIGYRRVGKVMEEIPQAAHYARLRAFTDTGIRTLATSEANLLLESHKDDNPPPTPPRRREEESAVEEAS